MTKKFWQVLFICCVVLGLPAIAQPEVVPAGAGGYASDIPGSAPDGMHAFADRELFIDANGKPIPTNDWWTDAIAQRWAGELWAHPLMARADERGLRLFYPTRWTGDGRDLAREFELRVSADEFSPTECRVIGWGDWSVDLRLPSGDKGIDVTLAHGMPYIWLQYSEGMNPTLNLPQNIDLVTERIRLPGGETARAIAFEFGDRWWAVVMSSRSDVARDGDRLVFRLDPRNRFLVFAGLPDRASLGFYAEHALARPTDTRFDWRYEPQQSRMVTTWEVDTQPLLGKGADVVQGWLPHHLRETEIDFKVDDKAGTFATPRGTMRVSTGKKFEIAYPYEGVLPHWPGDASDAKLKERAQYYTEGYAAERLKFAADTYWGGKDLWRAMRYGQIAQEYDLAIADKLTDAVRDEMKNWLTYEPGERDRYFASYPKWGGLVGVNPSYGSEGFNDHHFHYGYFLCTAGLLAMHDPDFVDEYAPMLRLIGEDYAGWSRESIMPRLRSFDPWNGHSWAGGMSAGGGNNQESSSEAVQAWAGMIFLGQALGDEEMLATGVMGYAIESRATLEYWFDWKQENWPKEWTHSAVGMIWSGGQLYGTYFSGDPAWVYAIQWCPPSPILAYLARDPEKAQHWLDAMFSDRSEKEGPTTAETLGPDLGNMVLFYQSLFDASAVVKQHDQWFAAGNPMARQHYLAGLTHMYAHHADHLGQVDPAYRTNMPTAVVYAAADGTRRLIAYNLSGQDVSVKVWKGDKIVGEFLVARRAQHVVEID